MNIDIQELSSCDLFRNIDVDLLKKHIDFALCHICEYPKGSFIVEKGDACECIGIVLEGLLSLNHFGSDGESYTAALFSQYDVLGLHLFAISRDYMIPSPCSIRARKKSYVLNIPFRQVEVLLENSLQFNKNYIYALSKMNFQFSFLLQTLHHYDVRSKLIHYLAYNCKGQTTFKLPMKKKDIADIIGVARPSLSRELHHMEFDGLIRVIGNKITLLKPEIFVL